MNLLFNSLRRVARWQCRKNRYLSVAARSSAGEPLTHDNSQKETLNARRITKQVHWPERELNYVLTIIELILSACPSFFFSGYGNCSWTTEAQQRVHSQPAGEKSGPDESDKSSQATIGSFDIPFTDLKREYIKLPHKYFLSTKKKFLQLMRLHKPKYKPLLW